MRLQAVSMLLCMLLVVSGKPPVQTYHNHPRQGGVPCALLDLTHPGGWSGVSRSGHTCYVSQPARAGLTSDARRVMGRAVRGTTKLQNPACCQAAWLLLPRVGGVAHSWMGCGAVYAETMRATDCADW
jgi:hypothetical protein